MPSPCLLCRHHHRRRRHRYALSFPRSSRRAASSRVVSPLSSPVTVTVVVVVVVPSVSRPYRLAGRRPEEGAIPCTTRGGSSPTSEARRSSASNATSVVATRIFEEEGSGSFFARQEGPFRRKEKSTETKGGEGGGRGGGGGGSPRGDSPSKCTRCRAERDAASRAKIQTIGETSWSNNSNGINNCTGRSNRTSDDPAVVAPVLTFAPVPEPALVSARVFEHADRRRFRRREASPPIGRLRRRRRRRRSGGGGGGGGGHGWTPRTVSPRRCTVWARCAPSTAAIPPRLLYCRPTCCS